MQLGEHAIEVDVDKRVLNDIWDTIYFSVLVKQVWASLKGIAQKLTYFL